MVGASAGGVEALRKLAETLPRELPAAVFVVLHIPPTDTSVLPDILDRAGRLPAKHASDREPVVAGRIYVAPPDFHMLLEAETVRVVRGPRENGHRPAVDTLFRSAAAVYGPRVMGVVLSGTLDDGSAGLRTIKARAASQSCRTRKRPSTRTCLRTRAPTRIHSTVCGSRRSAN